MRHVSTPEVHAFFSNSGSLAIFAVIRRASSLVSSLAASVGRALFQKIVSPL
jgi:hypothetical protein